MTHTVSGARASAIKASLWCSVVLTAACSSAAGGGVSADAGSVVVLGSDSGAPPGHDGGEAGTASVSADSGAVLSPPDAGGPEVLVARDAGQAPSGPAGSLVPGTSALTIVAAGQTRSVYLHVPSAAAAGQAPLVIALHGDGDTAENFVATSGLTADSDAEGFILAAPQGMTRDVNVYEAGQVVATVPQVDWDAYNSIQPDGSITSDNNLDVPLLDAIRQQLVASGSVDAGHLVVYGYSQGGYLSFRYGMSDSANVTCAAVIAAITPLPGTMLIEQETRKTPIVLQIGTEDYAFSNAAATVQELQSNGNAVQYNPIQGAGHVPIPGDPKVPLDWCLGR